MTHVRVLVRLTLAALAAALASCDNTFAPTSSGGPPFSVFGVLEATADTQWVRVNPLRSVLLASPAPTGARVTIQDTATGLTIELRDAALRFVSVLDTVYAHDFWTTERVRFGTTYRLRAQSSDGAVVESLVKVPRDIQLEVWARADPFKSISLVHIEGMSNLAFAIWKVTYTDGCNQSRLLRYVDATGQSLYSGPDTRLMDQCGGRASRITRQDVEIVASGDPWPKGKDLSVWRLAPDGNASDVAGGIGFLGGVVRRSIRVETCNLVPWPATQGSFCKLRYDSTTATLRGRIVSRCVPNLDSLAVQLRELDPPPGDFARVRPGIVTPALDFDIGALRPGIRHELTVTAESRYFSPYTDSLTFQAGQTLDYEARIQPWGGCS